MSGMPWRTLVLLPLLLVGLGTPWSCERPAEVRRAFVVERAPSGWRVAVPTARLARRAEGAPSEAGFALGEGQQLDVELLQPTRVVRLHLQAESGATLWVAASPNGRSFQHVWDVPALDPPGLRTRRGPALRLPEPVQELRIASVGGPARISDVAIVVPGASLQPWQLVALVWLLFGLAFAATRLPVLQPGAQRVLAGWRRHDAVVAVFGLALGAAWLAPAALGALAIYGLVARCQGATGERLWTPRALGVLVIVATVYLLLITRFSGNLAGPELLGSAYDSLADHLTRGRSTLDLWAIQWEAFRVEDRIHAYFGPLPAVLRIPANQLGPSFFGLWSRGSCLLASALSLAALALLLQQALAGNAHLALATRRRLLEFSLLGFGLACPLAFLMSAGSLYHESIVWGAAASAWGVFFAFRLAASDGVRRRALLGLSVAAGAALLARVTFGAPLYGILAVAGTRALRDAAAGEARGRDLALLGAVLLPAALCLAFQLWYNLDRFGSATVFYDASFLPYLASEADSWGFDPRRLPFAFANYFGLERGAFSASFPWVRVVSPEYFPRELYPWVAQSHVVSLWVVSPWLLIGAALGSYRLLGAPVLARWFAVMFLFELLLVMSYFLVEQRYALDFLPYLAFAYAFYLRDTANRPLAAGMPWLVAVSCLATLSSTVSWIPRAGPSYPPHYKASLIDSFERIDRTLGSGVGAAPERAAPEAGDRARSGAGARVEVEAGVQ